MKLMSIRLDMLSFKVSVTYLCYILCKKKKIVHCWKHPLQLLLLHHSIISDSLFWSISPDNTAIPNEFHKFMCKQAIKEVPRTFLSNIYTAIPENWCLTMLEKRDQSSKYLVYEESEQIQRGRRVCKCTIPNVQTPLQPFYLAAMLEFSMALLSIMTITIRKKGH